MAINNISSVNQAYINNAQAQNQQTNNAKPTQVKNGKKMLAIGAAAVAATAIAGVLLYKKGVINFKSSAKKSVKTLSDIKFEGELGNKKAILKENGKKFTGQIQHELKDGSNVTIKYKNGMLSESLQTSNTGASAVIKKHIYEPNGDHIVRQGTVALLQDGKDGITRMEKTTNLTQQKKFVQNALEVLNNVSTDNYSNIKDVASLLNNKNNIAILDLKGADDSLDIDKASNLISGLDEVSKRADGSIEKITSYAPNGQKIALKFDEQGIVQDFQILNSINDIDYSVNTANALNTNDININQDATYKAQALDLDTNSVDDNIFTQAQKNNFDVDVDYEADYSYIAANQNYVDIGTNSKATSVSRPDLEKYVNSNNTAKTISASKREQLNELVTGYYNDEVNYLTNLQKQGKLPKNYDIEASALAKANTYADHINFQSSRPDLFQNNMSSSAFWTEHKAVDGSHSAYKMHMYSIDEKDWEQLADAVIPYLNEHDIEWKTLNSLKTPEDLTGVQKGKAFTIYPKSNEEMAQIAKDLDYIIKARKLEINGAKIQGDNALGNTGRLHYRYEYKSKEFQNEIIDMRDHDDYQRYINMYRQNEGSSYLADDMLPEDDIWLGFDPSDPDSMPKI